MSVGTLTLRRADALDFAKKLKAAVMDPADEPTATIRVPVYTTDNVLVFVQLKVNIESKKRKDREPTASDRINDAFNNAGTPLGLLTRKAMLALIGAENVTTKALQFAGKQAGLPEPKQGVTPTSRCVSSLMAAVYATIQRPKRDRCTSAFCAELDANNDALVAGLESDAVATLAGMQYVKEMFESVHGRPLCDMDVAEARLLM